MTRHSKRDSITEDLINLLLKNGLAEGLPRIAELLLNAAMIVERTLMSDPGLLNAAIRELDTPMV